MATIAILDSGVDSEHEDLRERVISPSKDVVGHGTHCAGLAAAITDNGKGGASLIPGADWVSILPVKVMNDFGVGTEQTVIQGMIEAVDSGADVLSMSLGGRSRDRYQRAFEEAVQYATAHSVIVVAAAGNNSEDASTHVPANIRGVITVSAIDANGELASFSNKVSNLEMGVAAPGVDILSTYPNNKYQRLQGTSMATPQVAGLVGMMKALRPELTTREAYLMILKYGSPTGDLDETGVLINAENVIKNLIENSNPL
jgi:thermitase